MAISSTFTAADGDGYELQMGRWSRLLAPLFVQFAGIEDGTRVLDLGCGTGSLTRVLAQNPRIGAVQGVDLSPAYVDHARRHVTDARVQFEVGDACALRFDDATFDHALSMLVLQFIPEPERAVQEMKRVTRKGGTVAAATWDTETMPIHVMLFETAAELDPNARQIRDAASARPMARADCLRKAWQDARFAGVVQESVTIAMTFASFADFWAPIAGRDGPYAQYVSGLGTAERERVRSRVEAVYRNGEPDGPRSYPSKAWVVKGTVA